MMSRSWILFKIVSTCLLTKFLKEMKCDDYIYSFVINFYNINKTNFKSFVNLENK